MTTPPPLSGLRVLEFAGLAPGPFAGMLLADYGASVLRVDRAHPLAHFAPSSSSQTSSPASSSTTPPKTSPPQTSPSSIPPPSPPLDKPLDAREVQRNVGDSTAKPRQPPPTPDNLVRHKSSICVDFKSPSGISLIKALLPTTDVIIDPFRPGVLEKLGLGPDVVSQINPRCIFARMTGFRRDGKYAQMAGHDINYIAVSGVLSMLGRKGEKPYPPGNIIGDFAGGGAVCFMGILLALLSRQVTGRGQVVEANMVDGSAYLATMPRLAMKARESGGPAWNAPRGENLLDGGAPFYGTYETKDGKYVSVGALEPQFYEALLRGLGLREGKDLKGNRYDKRNWKQHEEIFTMRFKEKTRQEWEEIFDGTDACVAPVLEQGELERAGFDHRPIVNLKDSPAYAIAAGAMYRQAAEGQGERGVKGQGWVEEGLRPGAGGEEVLAKWMGWQRGKQFDVESGGLVLRDELKSKL